jgi:hypothetical protein
MSKYDPRYLYGGRQAWETHERDINQRLEMSSYKPMRHRFAATDAPCLPFGGQRKPPKRVNDRLALPKLPPLEDADG